MSLRDYKYEKLAKEIREINGKSYSKKSIVRLSEVLLALQTLEIYLAVDVFGMFYDIDSKNNCDRIIFQNSHIMWDFETDDLLRQTKPLLNLLDEMIVNGKVIY